MIDLEELERLAKAATPGPWKHRGFGMQSNVVFTDYTTVCSTNSLNMPHDAAYIVAACNAVPELIARVRELEAENADLKRQLRDALERC